MEELQQRVAAALDARDFSGLGKALDDQELKEPNLFDTPDWPHAVHIMAHIYDTRIEDARFAYKRSPDAAKKSEDVAAVFELLQRVWVKDYEGVWSAMEYAWPAQLQGLAAALRSRVQESVLELTQRAYSSISLQKLALLTGTDEQGALQLAEGHGWKVEKEGAGAGMVVPPPLAQEAMVVSEADLKRLAQYVVYAQSGEAVAAP